MKLGELAKAIRSHGAAIGVSRHRTSFAFTLIELLVVISIIALLIAVLMPALASVRRQVGLVTCASNLHAWGIGLSAYASQFGRYPPRSSQSVHIVYTEESGLDEWDNRQLLVDMVNGQGAEMFFCPLWGGARPPEGSPDPTRPLSDQYLTFGPAVHDRHFVGLHMLFLIRDTWLTFDWTNSGTPDGQAPYDMEPGDASVPLISDLNWGNLTDWQRPALSGHNMTHTDFWAVPGGPFLDSNVLYGDGHVVTRSQCEYYVLRSSTVYFAY